MTGASAACVCVCVCVLVGKGGEGDWGGRQKLDILYSTKNPPRVLLPDNFIPPGGSRLFNSDDGGRVPCWLGKTALSKHLY